MQLFDAAQHYLTRGQELVVIAGANYGCGSSRDWAAKGVRLLRARAVISEGFERIHRSDLVGMGVLPLQFDPCTTRKTLAIDGFETFTIDGLDASLAPGAMLTLQIRRRDGSTTRTPLLCRIDTDAESQIFEASGLLPRIRDDMRQASLTNPAGHTTVAALQHRHPK